MNKDKNKEKANRLIATINAEYQKSGQLSEQSCIESNSQDGINEQLHKDIIKRDDLTNDKLAPSDKLLERIDDQQDTIDDLSINITSTETEFYSSVEIAKQAISELRKYDSRKADELESRLLLKKASPKPRLINRKRI